MDGQHSEFIVPFATCVAADDFPCGDQPGKKGIERVGGALSAERLIPGEKYLFVDRVQFYMRMDGKAENILVLVGIGGTEQGTKLVLGLQMGDKRNLPPNWGAV